MKGNYGGTATFYFEITKAPLAITATPGQEKQEGDADPTFTYTVSGWYGTYSKDGLLSGSLGRASGEGAGDYLMNVGSLGFVSLNPNYEIVSVTGTFIIKAAPDESDWIPMILLIIAALTALLMIFLFVYVRYRLTGTVTYRGSPLEGVTVEYTLNGKSGTTVTDDNGHYMIRGLAGAEVAITNVTMEGYTVAGTMPEPFEIKRAVSVDFVMRKA
jgi:hypothetical protein